MITIFANMLKTLLYFLHHAKTFIKFLAHLLNKSKKISQNKKKVIEYFRILKKFVTRFFRTVENFCRYVNQKHQKNIVLIKEIVLKNIKKEKFSAIV